MKPIEALLPTTWPRPFPPEQWTITTSRSSSSSGHMQPGSVTMKGLRRRFCDFMQSDNMVSDCDPSSPRPEGKDMARNDHGRRKTPSALQQKANNRRSSSGPCRACRLRVGLQSVIVAVVLNVSAHAWLMTHLTSWLSSLKRLL